MDTRTALALLLMGCAACGETAERAKEEAAATFAAKNPLTETQEPKPEQRAFSGKVGQVLGAGSYRYLAIVREDGREVWVVTTRREIASGDRVSVRTMGVAKQFVSKRLGRTFDELLFAVVRPEGAAGRSG